MWAGLWQKRCKFPETATAIAYEQHGFFEQVGSPEIYLSYCLMNYELKLMCHEATLPYKNLFFHCPSRPRKVMRKQWRRLEKSTRGATSPQLFFQNTSCGRTTGYGRIYCGLYCGEYFLQNSLFFVVGLLKN